LILNNPLSRVHHSYAYKKGTRHKLYIKRIYWFTIWYAEK